MVMSDEEDKIYAQRLRFFEAELEAIHATGRTRVVCPPQRPGSKFLSMPIRPDPRYRPVHVDAKDLRPSLRLVPKPDPK